MNDRLKGLYKTVILRHHKDPVGFGRREGAGFVLEASNRMCGDVFKLYFDVENGRICRLRFDGHGCAISRASTSVLVSHVENLGTEEALEACREFLAIAEPDGPVTETQNETFEAFAATREFPGRHTCAILAWGELKEFLENQATHK